MAIEVLYSANWSGPTLIERDSVQTVSTSIERDATAPTITSATFTLITPDGTSVIDGQTATVAAGVVSYDIPADTLTTKAYGQRWLVRFDVTIASLVYSFYNDAALCKVRIFPPISHSDLQARHGDITSLLPSGVTSTQSYIDSAWIEITNRMYADAIPFWTIRTMSALRSPLLYRALALVFRDFSTLIDESDKYSELADRYDKSFEMDYMKLRGFFDRGEENIVDDVKSPISSVIVLSSRRRA